MRLKLKSPQDIAIMTTAGRKLARIRQALVAAAKPGVKLSSLEALAQQLIKQSHAQPSFAMVDGYQWATCINLNQGVVHGVPNSTVIKEGDIVSIDVGLFYRGLHSDTSTSFIASKLSRSQIRRQYPERFNFLQTGRQALKAAIAQAQVNNHIGHISQAIQQLVEAAGYSSIRRLTGHGIGQALHEPPPVPCFLDQPIKQTPKIKPGLTLAIEVIYAAGSPEIITRSQDHWTVVTKDGKMAAVFEHSIAITLAGPKILTTLEKQRPI
jgi:methionyl aminopeptidase